MASREQNIKTPINITESIISHTYITPQGNYSNITEVNNITHQGNYSNITEVNGNYSNITEVNDCGVSDVFSARIVNGEKANVGEYPWIVSIHINDRFECGGTILNERWIISAAHCFMDYGLENPASYVSVKVGSTDVTEGTKYDISKIIKHNSYDFGNYSSPDIALLKTKTDILKQKQGDINLVNSICLPKRKEEEPQSNSLVVIGWGNQKRTDDNDTEILMKVSVPVINDALCDSKYLSAKVLNSQICAKSVIKAACHGDSGGPAFEFVNGRAVLIGIVSWGNESCAFGYPQVYTQVSYFLDWIEENMK